MIPANTPPIPPLMTIREAAEALLARLKIEDKRAAIGQQIDLRAALMRGQRSRPGALPKVALALETIGRMKRGHPIEAGGIQAVVAMAELGVEELDAFDVRWNADMRAIERWQAGDALPADARSLLGEVGRLLRRYEASHREKVKPERGDSDTGNRTAKEKANRNASMAERIEAMLADGQPGARTLVWPDHADLVVWLMELIDREIEGFDMEEVGAVRDSLDGSDKAQWEAQKLIDRMGAALIAADRRAFIAETRAPIASWTPVGDDRTRGERIKGIIEREVPRVMANEIKAGHSVRVDLDGQRYEGIAAEDGKATLHLVDDPNGVIAMADDTMGQGDAASIARVGARLGFARSPEDRTHDRHSAIDDELPELEDIQPGKNTADYDRRQMEEAINAELAELPPSRRVKAIDTVALRIAPGWEYAIAPLSDPPLITLVRYAPNEPL